MTEQVRRRVYTNRRGQRFRVGGDSDMQFWFYTDGLRDKTWGCWVSRDNAECCLRRRAAKNKWTEVSDE
jgi:hypothetical protein